MSDRHELVKTLPWLRLGTTRLLAAVDGLTDDLLRAPSGLPGWTRAHVVGHLARNATEIPWLRIREVWLHTVDLRADVTVEDLPAGVIDLLLDDTTSTLSGKDGCPAVLLTPSDRDRTWQLPGSRGQPASVTAPAAELVGWLTGRTPGGTITDHLPQLPKWL